MIKIWKNVDDHYFGYGSNGCWLGEVVKIKSAGFPKQTYMAFTCFGNYHRCRSLKHAKEQIEKSVRSDMVELLK